MKSFSRICVVAFFSTLCFLPSTTLAGEIIFEMPTDGGADVLSWGRSDSDLGLEIGETIFPSGFPEGISEVCEVGLWIARSGEVSDNVTLSVYYEWATSTNPQDQQLIAQANISGSTLPTTTTEKTVFKLSQCTGTDRPFGTFWYVLNRSQPDSDGSYLAEVTQTGQYPSMFFITKDTQGNWTQDNTRELRISLEKGQEILDREPVIFIPGILGTRLNRADTGEEVWPNAFNLSSLADNHLKDLTLSGAGEDLVPISVGDIFEEIDIPGPINLIFYKNILLELETRGYLKSGGLTLFSYDWRDDLVSTANLFNQEIENLSELSPTGKVRIVAHSLGGVLVDQYLSTQDRSSIVSQVVLVGTPHLGAPKSFKALNYGENFDIPILNTERVQQITQNMSSVYQLLPSREYITRVGKGYVTDYRQSREVLSFDEINDFMTSDPILADHRNQTLLSEADAFHQNLDSSNVDDVPVINIVGCNQLTFSEFKIFPDQTAGIKTSLGDGTVPMVSAENFPGSAINYYLSEGQDINHLGLVKNEQMTRFIGDLVEGSLSNDYENVSTDKSACESNLQKRSYIVSTHSPVDLHVYDNQNQHTGLGMNGDIELGIPGSDFFKLGEESFAILPDGDYRFVIEAYATGNFDFDIEELTGTETTASESFSNVSILNPALNASLSFIGLENLALEIDETGDGTTDRELRPDSADITAPTITIRSPTHTSYARNQIVPIEVTIEDASSLAVTEFKLDGAPVGSSSLDLFFYKLGSHSFNVSSSDMAGNTASQEVTFRSISTVDSLVNDIERSYSLGWITTTKSRNDLIAKIRLATKINYLAQTITVILPDGSTYEQQVIVAQKSLSKLLIASIYFQLERDYLAGIIKKPAYDILREDLDWIMIR